MGATKFRMIRLDQLNLPQPGLRAERKKLDGLVASVDELGVLVPLVVRRLGKGEYVVVAGAGRLEALRRTGAGPATLVPCVVVEVDDAEAILLGLAENTVREPMRPFDEAGAARILVREYGYSQERVATALGMSQGMVSKILAVFDLDRSVVAALQKGAIEMLTARALLPLKGDAAAQRRLMARILKEKLSAREVAALVDALVHGDRGVAPLSYTVAGSGRVQARTTRSGKLRVVLEAADKKSLERLWRSLSKKLG
jgi:ParB family chromosome partitioning protein